MKFYYTKSFYFLCFFFVFLCSVCFFENVNAHEIEHDTKCDTSEISLTSGYSKYALTDATTKLDKDDFKASDYFVLFNSRNHIVYCTQYGAYRLNNPSGSSPNFVSTSKTVENNLMARTLAYGYYSTTEHSCKVSRLATQVMVHFVSKEIADGQTAWRTLTRAQILKLLGGSKAGSVATEIVRIRSLVLNHDLIPSFAFLTSDAAKQDPNRMELKYNETTRNFSNSVTDTKGVFTNFTLGANPTSITASKSDNTLTIASKDDSVTTPVSMSNTYKSGGTVYDRTHSVYQNMSYIVEPSTKTVSAYVGYKYQEIGKGIVKIHKVDKYTGKDMKDVSFGIFSDSSCTVKAVDYLGKPLDDKKTDEKGLVSWDNLYYPLNDTESRVYYVKEVVGSGYTTDNNELDKFGAKNACIPLILKASKIKNEDGSASDEFNKKEEVLKTVNNIPFGNITILKQDSDTGAVIPGVEFELVKNNIKKEPAIDINGNIVKNAITNEQGIAEFENIPYGDYILKEVKTTSSYKILEEPLEFTLNKENDALKYAGEGTEATPGKNEPMIPLIKYKLGDPNGDGKINAEDVNVIVDFIEKAAANEEFDKTSSAFYASDLNKDLVIDEKDKEILEKYIGGDVSVFLDALKEQILPGQIQKRVTLSITNVPIDMKISKQAITNEKELKGATIVIKNSKGQVFMKYVSTDKPKEFYIPVGVYTLTEIVAPKGYQTLKTDVKFRVLQNGDVKLLSAKSNMYKIDKSKDDNDTDMDHLKIYNNLSKISVPNTGSVIIVSSLIFGICLVAFGSYVIYLRYKEN